MNSARSRFGSMDCVEAASTLQGDSLDTMNLLAAAWKSGGMDHLAGYEQETPSTLWGSTQVNITKSSV